MVLLKILNGLIVTFSAKRKLRLAVLRIIGCKVGKNVLVADYAKIDSGHADMIMIEDYVHIAGGFVVFSET